MPVSGASIADLVRRWLRDYFGRIRNQDIPDDHDENAWKKLLFSVTAKVKSRPEVEGSGMNSNALAARS